MSETWKVGKNRNIFFSYLTGQCGCPLLYLCCQRCRVTCIWCIWKEGYKFRKRKIILTGQWLKNSYLCNVDFLCRLGRAKSFNFLYSLSICVKEKKKKKKANKTNSLHVQHLHSASGQGCHANTTNQRCSGMGWLCLYSKASKCENMLANKVFSWRTQLFQN